MEVVAPQYRIRDDDADDLKAIVRFANYLIRCHANLALGMIRNDVGVDQARFQALAPHVVVQVIPSGNDNEDNLLPHAATLNTGEVLLQQRLYDRAVQLDGLRRRGNQRRTDCQVSEARLLKFFLACALAHEMAHVVVRANLPRNQQQLANTSPQKFNIHYAGYQKPESGWYLEYLVFGGVICLLCKRGVGWTVPDDPAQARRERKIIGLVLETPDGLQLLDNEKILTMWLHNSYTPLTNCITERNYVVSMTEIAIKQRQHFDTIRIATHNSTPYVLKADEYVERVSRCVA